MKSLHERAKLELRDIEHLANSSIERELADVSEDQREALAQLSEALKDKDANKIAKEIKEIEKLTDKMNTLIGALDALPSSKKRLVDAGLSIDQLNKELGKLGH